MDKTEIQMDNIYREKLAKKHQDRLTETENRPKIQSFLNNVVTWTYAQLSE